MIPHILRSKITSASAYCAKLFQKIFPSIDRINTFAAFLALIISIISVIISWQSSSIDTADKRYKFWYEINSSYKYQQEDLGKIYPALLSRLQKASYIDIHIKNNELECHDLPALRVRNPISKSNLVSHYENNEMSILKTTTLELQPLASSLAIHGWGEYSSNSQYSYKWWSKLAWESMQLSFFPAQFQLKCAMARRTSKKRPASIYVAKKTIKVFTSDIHKTYDILPYMEESETPNLKAVVHLEDENTVSGSLSVNTIQKFYSNSSLEKFNKIISYLFYLTSGAHGVDKKIAK